MPVLVTLTEVPDVLLKMLKQEKRRAAEGEVALKEAGLPPLRSISPILGRTSPHAMNLLPSPRSEEQANNCTAMKTSSQPGGGSTVAMETRTSVDSTHHTSVSSENQDSMYLGL